MNEYDPHVAVDLHTTNGTRHAYHLTYAPPLHPNTPTSIDDLLRDEWLPEITERVKEKHGWDYYYYGNAFPRGGEQGCVIGETTRSRRTAGTPADPDSHQQEHAPQNGDGAAGGVAGWRIHHCHAAEITEVRGTRNTLLYPPRCRRAA